eukprot:Hpha_TRINITY_DN15974_c5_g2::TRINITY_DN15974_c5_g2_i1::g.71188::m.71188/K17915/KIF14; kinesin family member 14
MPSGTSSSSSSSGLVVDTKLPSPRPLGRSGSRRGSVTGTPRKAGRSPSVHSEPKRKRSIVMESGEISMLARTRSSIIRRNLDRLEGSDHVRAMIRVRPFLPSDGSSSRSTVLLDGKRIALLDSAGKEKDAFLFDNCFGPDDDAQESQEYIFDAAGIPAVENAIAGYNSCVFAYGQTCSGKTHTMIGPRGIDPLQGIMPRAVGLLFEKINALDNCGAEKPEVHCQFYEIYMERVRDLLHDDTGFHDLRVRNHPISGPFIEGLTSHPVPDAAALLRLVTRGSRERTTSATPSNDTSSRSHAVLEISVRIPEVVHSRGSEVVSATTSKLNLVDLAGSERISTAPGLSYNTDETSSINLSLSTLRRVIDTLIDNTRTKQRMLPPYRESLLTWILSESLGGNSRTVMIGTVSPNPDHVEETHNTLRYVHKAKGIVNVVRRNEDKHVSLIKALQAEIERLQSRVSDGKVGLESDGSGAGSPTPHELLEQIRLRNQIIEDLRTRGMMLDAGTQTDAPVLGLVDTSPHASPKREARVISELQLKHRALQQALQVQKDQEATLAVLRRELVALQDQLRTRNAEQLELKQTCDTLASQKAKLTREVGDLREVTVDTQRAMEAAEKGQGSSEALAREYEDRLSALREALEAKIRAVEDLADDNRELRNLNRQLEGLRRVHGQNLDSSGVREGPTLEEQLQQMQEAKDEAVSKARRERELRHYAEHQLAELNVEQDLLRSEHQRLRGLVEARGLVIVGSGKRQDLVCLGLSRESNRESATMAARGSAVVVTPVRQSGRQVLSPGQNGYRSGYSSTSLAYPSAPNSARRSTRPGTPRSPAASRSAANRGRSSRPGSRSHSRPLTPPGRK